MYIFITTAIVASVRSDLACFGFTKLTAYTLGVHPFTNTACLKHLSRAVQLLNTRQMLRHAQAGRHIEDRQ